MLTIISNVFTFSGNTLLHKFWITSLYFLKRILFYCHTLIHLNIHFISFNKSEGENVTLLTMQRLLPIPIVVTIHQWLLKLLWRVVNSRKTWSHNYRGKIGSTYRVRNMPYTSKDMLKLLIIFKKSRRYKGTYMIYRYATVIEKRCARWSSK